MFELVVIKSCFQNGVKIDMLMPPVIFDNLDLLLNYMKVNIQY